MSEMTIGAGTVESARPFFSIAMLVALIFQLSGCAHRSVEIDKNISAQPFVAIFMEASDRFRLEAGFSGSTGVTNEIAINLGKMFCHEKKLRYQEIGWTTKSASGGFGEHNVKIGSLVFSCN